MEMTKIEQKNSLFHSVKAMNTEQPKARTKSELKSTRPKNFQ